MGFTSCNPSYGLEIDNDHKPHVQQRSPGVIFRLDVLALSTGPLQCIRELRQRVSCADPG
jgi:hypothetical protein